MPLTASAGVPADAYGKVGTFQVMRDNTGLGLTAGVIYNGSTDVNVVASWTSAGAITGGGPPGGTWRVLNSTPASGVALCQRIT